MKHIPKNDKRTYSIRKSPSSGYASFVMIPIIVSIMIKERVPDTVFVIQASNRNGPSVNALNQGECIWKKHEENSLMLLFAEIFYETWKDWGEMEFVYSEWDLYTNF